jgi:hypothetical protein
MEKIAIESTSRGGHHISYVEFKGKYRPTLLLDKNCPEETIELLGKIDSFDLEYEITGDYLKFKDTFANVTQMFPLGYPREWYLSGEGYPVFPANIQVNPGNKILCCKLSFERFPAQYEAIKFETGLDEYCISYSGSQIFGTYFDSEDYGGGISMFTYDIYARRTGELFLDKLVEQIESENVEILDLRWPDYVRTRILMELYRLGYLDYNKELSDKTLKVYEVVSDFHRRRKASGQE